VELVDAFTSAFKRLDPVPQFKATAKLGSFLAQLPAKSRLGPFWVAIPRTVRLFQCDERLGGPDPVQALPGSAFLGRATRAEASGLFSRKAGVTTQPWKGSK
jgi:hypothetical protein